MTRSMTATLLMLIFGFAQSAVAESYSNGYVNSAGYTYNDGYWWKGDTSYTLSRVRQTYYHNGCQHYSYVNKYYPAYVQKAAYVAPYVAPKVVVTKQDIADDGGLGKLLDIARHRDEVEGEVRKANAKHNIFVESVRLLGMEGNFRWNGYGYELNYAKGGVPYAGYNAYGKDRYSQVSQTQGATVYGYRELADIYGSVDLGAVYNQVLRLRQQSYANESQATSETHALVGELGDQMARIKEVEAKGRAAAQALEAANAKDHATLLREYWGTGKQAATQLPQFNQQTPASIEGIQAQLAQLVQNKCTKCHNAQQKNGDLDMTNLASLGPKWAVTLQRVIDPDPSKRMPLAAVGEPGTPLTPSEVALFYLGAYADGVQQPAKAD